MGVKLRKWVPAATIAMRGVVLLLAFSSGLALANSAEGSPNDRGVLSASATLHFRIVIPETLRIEGDVQRRSALAPRTTRTVTVEDGRQLVTIARP